MANVSCTLNDGILLFAFFYSSIDIFMEWDHFHNCYHPIQLWLIISYASILAFRASHYLGQYLSEDGEEFLLYTQRGPPFWVNFLILGILFPFFCVWTVVGTVWFSEIQINTPTCLPRGSHPWFIIFWLSLCYVWIILYLLFIVVALVFEYRARRAESELRLIENDDIIRRWGRLRILADYGIHLVRRGLSPEQIQALPSETITRIPHEHLCSICIEELNIGDEVRILQSCGHLFHKSCIDIWLLRNAVCPNCKAAIAHHNQCSSDDEVDECHGICEDDMSSSTV